MQRPPLIRTVRTMHTNDSVPASVTPNSFFENVFLSERVARGHTTSHVSARAFFKLAAIIRLFLRLLLMTSGDDNKIE